MLTAGSENSDEVHKHPQKPIAKVKQSRPDMKWKGVVYELSCKDCPCVYIGETGRTLEKRQSEHRIAVQKNDPKNRFAVRGWAQGKSQLGRRFSQAREKRLLEEKDPF